MNLLGSAHLTLDGGDGVFGVGDRLTLCNLAYQTLAGFGKADNRRGGTALVCIKAFILWISNTNKSTL